MYSAIHQAVTKQQQGIRKGDEVRSIRVKHHMRARHSGGLQFMMPQGSRSRLRRDEMRTIVAHVYRLLAADLAPTTLQEDAPLRIKITDWIIDTLKYLQAGIAGKLCQAALVTYSVSLTCWPTAILRIVQQAKGLQ